jgi:hypothetical protein
LADAAHTIFAWDDVVDLGQVTHREGALYVPKTSSTSCDQAIFVDQATDTSPFTDAVLAEIDRLR